MNLHQRIHQVAAQDGILAVLAVRSANGEQTFVGRSQFRRLAEQAAKAQQVSPVDTIRVNAGGHAIFVSGDADTSIAILFEKAHPVVKSVKRTIRQLLRKSQREAARRAPTYVSPARLPSRPPSAPPAAANRAWPM